MTKKETDFGSRNGSIKLSFGKAKSSSRLNIGTSRNSSTSKHNSIASSSTSFTQIIYIGCINKKDRIRFSRIICKTG